MLCLCREVGLLDWEKVQKMKLEEKIDTKSIKRFSVILFVFWLIAYLSPQWSNKIISYNIEHVSLKIILTILYSIGCAASFYLVKDENEKGSLILLLGAYTAFVFSVSLVPTYSGIYSNQNIIGIIEIIIELEVLLLAIGVPIVFNGAIRDEDPEKHYYSMKLLKIFIIYSVIVTLSSLFILMILNYFLFEFYHLSNFTIGYIISIFIFNFIFSIFLFIYIIFDLVSVYLKHNPPLMVKFENALIENNLHAIDEYNLGLDNESKKDVLLKVLRAGHPNFEGIYYFVKKDVNIQKETSVQLYFKLHIEDAIQNNNEDKIDKCYEILDESCIISVVSEFIYNINKAENYEKIAKSLHIILYKDPHRLYDVNEIKVLYQIIKSNQNKNLDDFIIFLEKTFEFTNIPGVQ